jgi:hypothetical protein
VRRGNGVVYVGGSRAPVQPNEDEFHVHPCFRPALGSLGQRVVVRAGDIQSSHTIGSAPSFSQFQVSNVGADTGYPSGARLDARLPLEIERTRARLLRRLERSALGDATRAEVAGRIESILSTRPNPADALRALAAQLAEDGVRDEALIRLIDEEARALARVAGGAEGRGTGSSSG